MSGFDYAQIERRIASLESNRGASLRFGVVSGTDAASGTARVQLPDGEGMVSMPLRVLQRRTLKDKAQSLPGTGEPVAVLFSGQGLEQGVVLGAHYTSGTPSPAQEAQVDFVRYEDGTELCYDRKAHKLIANVKGSVELKAEKDVAAESMTRISLKAPVIELQGNLVQTGYDGGAATSDLRGSFTVRDGGIAVPDRDVTAGSVSLCGHTHTGVENGPDTSGTPVGG